MTVAYAKPRQRHRNEDEPTSKTHVQVSKDPSLPTLRPRLIFRNLSWKIRNPEHLEKHLLAPYGKPKEIRIPRGKGGKMTGFAFVEMKTRKAAGKVIEHVNGMEIEGRPVAVDWCVNKDEWTQHHKETAKEASEEVEVKTEDEEEDDGIEEEEDTDEEEELPEPNSQTLFIRNIPYLVTRATLFNLFRPLGHVASLYLVTDPQTNLSRGTAFLTFSSATRRRNSPRTRFKNKSQQSYPGRN